MFLCTIDRSMMGNYTISQGIFDMDPERVHCDDAGGSSASSTATTTMLVMIEIA